MNVIHDNNFVRIDGISGFNSCEYCSSVHGSEAVILQSLGSSLSYNDLICYSGFAFRVAVHEKMCPSAGHPACGYMCLENSTLALPRQTKCFESFPWGKQRTESEQKAFETDARKAIKESVDRGVPVHYGSEEDGLIIGYSDNGKRWWCLHPYHKDGTEPFWFDESEGFAGGGDKWPWDIIIWLDKKNEEELVDGMTLTLGALRQAVDMWHCTKVFHNAYFTGDAAYEQWLRWLRNIDSCSEVEMKAGMQGNAWCFCVLNHCRNIASTWLHNKIGSFDSEAGSQLLIAADNYRKLTDCCLAGVSSTWAIAPPPGKFDEWTEEKRGKQIARLESAREFDRAAITAISKFLDAFK